MTIRKTLTAVFSGTGILILILDVRTALRGASLGLELCMKAVIPSLFPFLFLCTVLTGALWGNSFPLLSPVCRRLGIPCGAESLLISALLGGYPAGAQAIGQAYGEGRLNREDACRLLRFCSNAGPAFLFGMTALQFPDRKSIWAMWMIQILSALLTGILFAPDKAALASLSGKPSSVPQVLTASVRITGILCGWIILFRIITEYLCHWFFRFFPPWMQVLLTGLLELSNGCCALGQIPDPAQRFTVCSVLLSFGGLCVIMQTASVLRGLPLKPYLMGKTIQTGLSLILSLLYLRLGFPALVPAGMVLFFPGHRKIEVDFQEKPMYNDPITTRRNKTHVVS